MKLSKACSLAQLCFQNISQNMTTIQSIKECCVIIYKKDNYRKPETMQKQQIRVTVIIYHSCDFNTVFPGNVKSPQFVAQILSSANQIRQGDNLMGLTRAAFPSR